MEKEDKADFVSWLSIAALVFAAISPLSAKDGTPSPILSPVYACVSLATLGGIVAGCVRPRPRRLNTLVVDRLLIAVLCAEEVLVLPGWSLLGDSSYEGLFKSLSYVLQVPLLSLVSAASGYLSAVSPRTAADTSPDCEGRMPPLVLAAIVAGYLPRFLWSLPELTGVSIFPGGLMTLVAYLAAAIVLIRQRKKCAFNAAQFCCAYSLGMLLWALLTRVIALYDSAVLAVTPLVICAIVALVMAIRPPTSELARLEEAKSGQEEKALEALRDAGLTERELQLAKLARAGKTSKQMAADLGISASTVRVTLGKVYKKLGIAGLEDLRSFEGPGTEKHDVPKETAKTGARHRIAQVLLTVLPLLPVAAGSPKWGQGQPLLMGAALALLAFGTLSLVLPGPRALRLCGGARPIAATIAASLGVALLFSVLLVNVSAGQGPMTAPYALEFLCAALYVGNVLVLWSPQAPGAVGSICFSGLLVFFFLGVTLEEIWRSTTAFSVLGSLVPFAAVAGYCAVLLLTDDAGLRLRCAVAGAMALVLGLLGIVALWVSLALALVPIAILMFGNTGGDTGSAAMRLISFAVGILAGVLIVNWAEDNIVQGTLVPAALRGVTSGRLVACAAMLALSIPGIASACVSYSQIRNLRKLGEAPTHDERLQGFLISRGLNAVESRAVTFIAQGKTTAQIAKELHYSQGMINTARRSAYAKLDVNSIEGLLELFSQHIGA